MPAAMPMVPACTATLVTVELVVEEQDMAHLVDEFGGL